MKRFLICFLLSSLCMFAINAQEDNFDRIIRRGVQLHEQGDFNAAIKCYQEGLKLRPKSTLPYFQIACCYASLNNYKAMAKSAEKAILVDEEHFKTEDKVVYYLEALSMYITLILKNERDSDIKNPGSAKL